MNRNEAKRIAEIVTIEDLKQMFTNAQSGIKDWTKTSTVNAGMTKGTAFNILSIKGAVKDRESINDIHILAIINMIREFGEFLPAGYEKSIPEKKESNPPFHQDPKFF